MRIVYFGNNWAGWQVLKWLKERGEDVVGLVMHPAGKQKYAEEIVEASGLPAASIIDGSCLRDADVLDRTRGLAPEIGVSVLFDYVLRKELISIFPHGVVNLHPSLLPYNRGQYPNVWSIIEGTPSGVTMHYIDEGIDSGDIIAQKEVPTEPTDTGESLYRKLERASLQLFEETWPPLKSGRAPRIRQQPGGGTYHGTKDVEAVDEIDLDETCRARDLIDLIRARTFPPYPGAYARIDGKKVYLRLELIREEDLGRKEE